MSDGLRRQIYSRMNLKETDDLLEIWQTNDRAEWSDTAFQVIEEILKERSIALPRQNPPVYEHTEKEDEIKEFNFSEAELKIIGDENPPEFYNPADVIKTGKQIETVARVMIGLGIATAVANSSTSFRIAQGYFFTKPNSSIVYIVTATIVLLNAAVGISIVYFPLQALSRILKILMEMEFNSRKAQP